MKFSSSVTQSIIECLQDLKAASAGGALNAAAHHKPARYALPPQSENADVSKWIAHVLLVDDDAGVRDFLANLLRGAGYRVTCAADGEEAWVALCADKYDVLVTDHSMPKLTGLDLIRRLRVGPLNALPCVLVSGEIPWEEKDLLDLVRPGMAMAKPFSFLELLTCVRSLFSPTASAAADAIACLPREPERNQLLRPENTWQDDAQGRQSRRRLVRAG